MLRADSPPTDIGRLFGSAGPAREESRQKPECKQHQGQQGALAPPGAGAAAQESKNRRKTRRLALKDVAEIGAGPNYGPEVLIAGVALQQVGLEVGPVLLIEMVECVIEQKITP